MVSAVAFGFVLGAVLGTYFNVLILIPAMSLALIAAAAGLASGGDAWDVFATMMVLCGAMQLGYLAGSAGSVAIGAKRGGRRGGLRHASEIREVRHRN